MINAYSKRLLIAVCLCFDDINPLNNASHGFQDKTYSDNNASLARIVATKMVCDLKKNPKLKSSVDLTVVSGARWGEFFQTDTPSRSQDNIIKIAYDLIIDRQKKYYECEIPVFVPSMVIVISDGTYQIVPNDIATLNESINADSLRNQVYAIIQDHYDPELKLSGDFIVPITIRIGKANNYDIFKNGVNPFDEIVIEDYRDIDNLNFLDHLPYFNAHQMGKITRKLLLDEFSRCIANCCQSINSARHRRVMDTIQKDMEELLSDLCGIDND